jgi:hypothetical protein
VIAERGRFALLFCCAAVASAALADDIVTTTGVKYENATVTRAEPDGLVIQYSAGIVKIPFAELNQEWQTKYNYNAARAQEYVAEIQRQQAALYQQTQAAKAQVAQQAAELAKQAEAQRTERAEQKKAAREKANHVAEVEAAIAERRLLIGMTQEECTRSWGSPETIHITTTAAGQRSKWIYPWATIFIENGVLTEIDNPDPAIQAKSRIY